MRIYENIEEPPGEWCITSTLTLDDTGRFEYDELATCYAGSARSAVEGLWRQEGAGIRLQAEQSSHHSWHAGEERKAFEDGDDLRIERLDHVTPLRRRRDAERA